MLRNNKTTLQNLFDNAKEFSFFQTVRLLEQFYPAAKTKLLSFSASASMVHPDADVESVQEIITTVDAEYKINIAVSFLSLAGVSGVLPYHYTELLLSLSRAKDFAMQKFLDIFHQTALKLFYDCWAKYHFYIDFERHQGNLQDATSQFIYHLSGVNNTTTQAAFPINKTLPLYFAGYFTQQRRSAAALQALLAACFNVPIKIKQLQGQWLNLGKDNCTTLATNNNQLGISTLVGSKVWSCQQYFTIEIGPIAAEQMSQFFPRTETVKAICQLTRIYVGLEFSFGLEIILPRPAIKNLQLNSTNSMNLGWNTWLVSDKTEINVFKLTFGEIV